MKFSERERLSKNQEELDSIKQENADMELDMERCREKEKELLEFTQKLTETNVRLQSDYTAIKEKVKYWKEFKKFHSNGIVTIL